MLNIRESRKEKFLCEMNTFDALLTPTFKSVAPKVDEVDQSISPGHFTRPFNYLGFCGVSIPVSLSKNCLPIGFQIIGRATDEETVLRIGYAIESIIPSIGRPSL